MVPEILNILEFRSNNIVHRPIILALELIKRYAETGLHYFPLNEPIPIDSVIRAIDEVWGEGDNLMRLGF
jgi:hypothetical protein